jgi:sialidase-1
MPSTNDHEGYVGMSFYSDDQGHTWKPSDNAVDMYPVEFQEADAVELKDGRLMMFGRTYSGHPAKAYSNDKGKTWSQGELITTLDQPYPGLPTVRRIPSTGDLLFIWCGEVGYTSTGGALRSALTCAISQDEGQTFIHRQNLVSDPQGDFGYQSIEFLNNDLALVGYYARDGLHVAQVSTDWLYEAPEPGSLTLLAIGLAGVMGYTWRKRKR